MSMIDQEQMRLLVFAVLLAAFVAACPPAFAAQDLKIVFIDVGQGDSTLIIFPSGKTMLIDGGERYQSPAVLSVLQNYNITRIDAMIATHPHVDHIGGLIDVMDNMSIGQVIDSGQIHTTQTFEDFVSAVDSHHIPLVAVHDGDAIGLDPAIDIQVLNPPVTVPVGAHDEEKFNNNSVAIKLTYGKFKAIFPGDIEQEAESRLASRNIDVDVLLASHHGSRGSNTAPYLAAASPQVVVIYAGANNSYDHPHQEALDRIAAAGVQQVFRTDIDGTIVLTTAGDGSYTLETAESNKVVTVPEFDRVILVSSVLISLTVFVSRGRKIWK